MTRIFAPLALLLVGLASCHNVDEGDDAPVTTLATLPFSALNYHQLARTSKYLYWTSPTGISRIAKTGGQPEQVVDVAAGYCSGT